MSDKTTYSFEDLLSQVQVCQIYILHDMRHTTEIGTMLTKAVCRVGLEPR